MSTDPRASRRTVLAAAAGAVGASAVASAPTVAAQPSAVEEHLSDVDTYDGVVDRTGQDQVTVSVGTGQNGFRFDPSAIRVAPGTTVVWEWTGKGGGHNVVEVETEDGFASEQTDEAGHTFEQTFDEPGYHLYVCEPHAAAGMKGAVVVAPPDPTPAVEEHLSGIDSYDGIADRRGQDQVTVDVGSGQNGFRFGPPAVRVDPGATVLWEWTGAGGGHNVVEVETEDGFASEQTDEAGHTFEQTFDEPGYHLYVCEPHASAGMRGAVVVGDAGASGGGGAGGGSGGGGGLTGTTGLVLALLLAPVAGVLALLGRELSDKADRTGRRA